MTAFARLGLVGLVLTVAACSSDGDTDDGAAGTAVPVTSAAAASAPAQTSSASAAGTPAPSAGATTTSGAATTAAPGTTEAAPEPAVTFSEVASLSEPVDLAWRHGDPGLYVVGRDGTIVRLGEDQPATVLDITDLTEGGGERGLLGLAFHPDGDPAYVDYTDNQGRTIIAEYPVRPDGTFGAAADSRVVLEIDQPYPNHNGGDLTFGPDGMLYIGMGDGGSGGDPERRATDMTSLLGKMLRIDPAAAGGQTYSVPADNPLVGQAGTAPEIWSSGLRNPWRFSFDRETGDLWIADVGENAVEEIDVAPASGGVDAGKGLSFGWSAFEGTERFNDDVPAEGHVPPIHTYTHADGCSVSGGTRARGDAAGTLEGWYVYGDYCSGTVWALEVIGEGASMTAGRNLVIGTVEGLTAIVEGPGGELYALSQEGPVLRLDAA